MFQIVKTNFDWVIHHSALPEGIVAHKETKEDVYGHKAKEKNIIRAIVTCKVEFVLEESQSESN